MQIYIIIQVILALWLVLAYDLLEDRRIDHDSARFKFFWIWTNQNSLLSIETNQFASFCIDKRSRQCYFRVWQSGEIWNKKVFFPYILIFYHIKQRFHVAVRLFSNRWRQNVVRTKKWHTRRSRLCHWCSYHILASSVIYYWTDARQHGLYLLNRLPTMGWHKLQWVADRFKENKQVEVIGPSCGSQLLARTTHNTTSTPAECISPSNRTPRKSTWLVRNSTNILTTKERRHREPQNLSTNFLLINILQSAHIDLNWKKLHPFHNEWYLDGRTERLCHNFIRMQRSIPNK